MKVFLTGASGLLGRALDRRFRGNCELLATAFSRSEPPLQRLDLRCAEDVSTAVRDFSPRVIIHSAAERRPDVCDGDHEATDSLNVTAAETLAAAAKQVGACLVYISTDYVFDGTSSPYSVQAEPNPLNYYGLSKRAGEVAALESGARVCVLRVPILYGPVETLEESAVTVLARLPGNGAGVGVDDLAIRYPTHVDDIAAAVYGLLGLVNACEHVPSILHFSGDEAFTKFEMANIIAEACGLDASNLRPSREEPAVPRPFDCHLDDTLLASLVPVSKRSFREEIGRLVSGHLR